MSGGVQAQNNTCTLYLFSGFFLRSNAYDGYICDSLMGPAVQTAQINRIITYTNVAMNKTLTDTERKNLLAILQERFKKNASHHPEIQWDEVRIKLEQHPAKLWSLHAMEMTGGEPDVVGKDSTSGELLFFDCVAESPKGRRSVCYDQEALESRKQHKPAHSAVGMAAEMGIELLTESQYRQLQDLQPVDTKTSSWLATPTNIRERGGAIFGDWRYGQAFVYHNGAESYYAARGFRGCLRV